MPKIQTGKFYWLGEGVLSIASGRPKIKNDGDPIPADLLKLLNPKKLKDFIEKGLIGKNSPDEHVAKANKNAEKAVAALRKEVKAALKDRDAAVKERGVFETQLNEQLEAHNEAVEAKKKLEAENKILKKANADLMTANLKLENQLKNKNG